MEAMIGVIGTILGTFLGWFLNSISNQGKINVFALSWNNKFLHNSKTGEMIKSSAVEETAYYSYDIVLDIHNSSGEPKIMRNISIVFSNGKIDVVTHIPNDVNTKKISGNLIYYDKIGPLTIPAKSVVQIHLNGGFWRNSSEFHLIWDSEKEFLLYTDEKNKEKRILLNSKSIKQSFNEQKGKNNDDNE